MRKYFYRELFSKEVFNLFEEYSKEYAEKIGNLEIDEHNLSIDIDQILNIMNIPVEETLLDYRSGEFDPNNLKILVNATESPERKRFTKAHELGHSLLKDEGFSYRKDADVYDNKERKANKLAAEILMPKNLVAIAVDLYQTRKNLTDQELERENPMTFTVILSKYLNVSMSAMRYRLINLGVLVDEEH